MNISKYLYHVNDKLTKLYPLKKKSSNDLKDLYFLINLFDITKNESLPELSSEVDINSPIMAENKTKTEILKSDNFIKRYSVFLKIIFSALLMNVEIFKIYRDNQVFLNLYDMKNSFLKRKKKILQDIITYVDDNSKILKSLLDIKHTDYQNIFAIALTQMKVIDKVISIINKLIDNNLLKETESIISLVMPFFYKYQDFIETYKI